MTPSIKDTLAAVADVLKPTEPSEEPIKLAPGTTDEVARYVVGKINSLPFGGFSARLEVGEDGAYVLHVRTTLPDKAEAFNHVHTIIQSAHDSIRAEPRRNL